MQARPPSHLDWKQKIVYRNDVSRGKRVNTPQPDAPDPFFSDVYSLPENDSPEDLPRDITSAPDLVYLLELFSPALYPDLYRT
jgi:hypothetical protein